MMDLERRLKRKKRGRDRDFQNTIYRNRLEETSTKILNREREETQR